MATFADKVIKAVCNIPYGKVMCYSQIALLAGAPRAARAVGTILRCDKRAENAPCHRVVTKDGRLSSVFGALGAQEQRRLLEQEGIVITEDLRVDMEHYCARIGDFVWKE